MIGAASSEPETPWFEMVEKVVGDKSLLHYSISTRDYLSVFAVTPDGRFPLVRQFRPAVEMITLELPGGHVEADETPEQAARKELREETGFIADELILSVKTVARHISNIFDMTGAENRSAATAYAFQKGLATNAVPHE